MQTFKFLGIDKTGRRITGEFESLSLKEAEYKLESRGLDLIYLKAKTTPTYASFMAKKPIKRKDIINLTLQLEQLLRSGMSLIDVLEELKSSLENPNLKEIMQSIYQEVDAGESFSQALMPYKNVFSEVYISLVAAGENSGNLTTMLANLAAMLKWEDELASKTKKVMIYPAILVVVITAVTLLMMLFVVPELLSFIQEMGQEPSWATISLIATSSFLEKWGIYLVGFLVLFLIVMKIALKNLELRRKYDLLILGLPVVGKILYKIKIARVAQSLAVIYSAGIDIAGAIKMSAKVTGNSYLESKFDLALNRILSEGDSIYQAFELAQVFPTMGLKMIKVGEQSKSLGQALHNISYFYEREAKEAIDKLEPTLEPLLTLIMAFVIGWVMLAVLEPIYSTISQVDF